jgi:hypothetical protein
MLGAVENLFFIAPNGRGLAMWLNPMLNRITKL